jgi:hypothetical protein
MESWSAHSKVGPMLLMVLGLRLQSIENNRALSEKQRDRRVRRSRRGGTGAGRRSTRKTAREILRPAGESACLQDDALDQV